MGSCLLSTVSQTHVGHYLHSPSFAWSAALDIAPLLGDQVVGSNQAVGRGQGGKSLQLQGMSQGGLVLQLQGMGQGGQVLLDIGPWEIPLEDIHQ